MKTYSLEEMTDKHIGKKGTEELAVMIDTFKPTCRRKKSTNL